MKTVITTGRDCCSVKWINNLKIKMSTNDRMAMETLMSNMEGIDKMRMMKKSKLFRRIEADIKERDRKRKPGQFFKQIFIIALV